LIIVRSDLHLIHEWDVLIEGRRLSVHEAEDSRTGVLAAIYRQPQRARETRRRLQLHGFFG
jgi:hypothetical protein